MRLAIALRGVTFLVISIYSAATAKCQPGPKFADWFLIQGGPASRMRIGITIAVALALLFSTVAVAQTVGPLPGYAGSWLHFDEAHKRVTISKNMTPWLPVNPNTHLHIVGADDRAREVSIECAAFGSDCVLNGFRANGTAEKPEPLKKDDYITTWVSGGTDGMPIIRKDGTKIWQKQGASISHRSCADWDEKNHCVDIRFYPRRASDSPNDLFEGAKIGGEEGDMLTVNGILHTKDRMTATAIDEPDTPPPGKAYLYFDKATKQLCVKNDEGKSRCF
jgi:hypothetical protein